MGQGAGGTTERQITSFRNARVTHQTIDAIIRVREKGTVAQCDEIKLRNS
jgi:hypothetical protein